VVVIVVVLALAGDRAAVDAADRDDDATDRQWCSL
jgi:hypothetical protein